MQVDFSLKPLLLMTKLHFLMDLSLLSLPATQTQKSEISKTIYFFFIINWFQRLETKLEITCEQRRRQGEREEVELGREDRDGFREM